MAKKSRRAALPCKGDKVARALSVQPILSQELCTERSEPPLPEGKHDDLVETMTQALRYLRDVGLAHGDDDVKAEEDEE